MNVSNNNVNAGVSSDSLVSFWTLVAENLLSPYVRGRDIAYYRKRAEAEGISFITITLPKLGKCLDRSFETGILDIPAELGFGLNGVYPVFLCDAWKVLFDEEGRLRWYDWSYNGLFASPAAPCSEYADAALIIRQLTLMYYKVKLPYAVDQIDQTISSFLRTEDDLSRLDITGGVISPALTRARQLVHRLVSRSNPRAITPKHGSGASACGTIPWNRYGKPRYWKQIDGVYPYTEWYVSGLDQIADEYPDLFDEPLTPYPVAKVVMVPKDSRGPRLISEEPRETMFLQQGLMAMLYECIEHYPNVRQQVSCIDQERNRLLACLASQTGAFATLDMKEASDRVSVELVSYLFPSNWVECLLATRCQATELPDGTIVPLRKFAPMGSATCFPVEAICFWALSVAAIEEKCGNLSHLFSLSPHRQPHVIAAVFGDDLIVPTVAADNVVTVLESVGLMVNKDKCFTRGPFRESCGGDYLSGYSISLVRASHLMVTGPLSRADVAYSLHRTVDCMNNIIKQYGFEFTIPFQKFLKRMWNVHVDIVDMAHNPDGLQGLSLYGLENSFRRTRLNHALCRREAWLRIESAADCKVDLTGWCQYFRGLLMSNPETSIEYVSPARRYRYKLGWVTYRG